MRMTRLLQERVAASTALQEAIQRLALLELFCLAVAGQRVSPPTHPVVPSQSLAAVAVAWVVWGRLLRRDLVPSLLQGPRAGG